METLRQDLFIFTLPRSLGVKFYNSSSNNATLVHGSSSRPLDTAAVQRIKSYNLDKRVYFYYLIFIYSILN